MARTFYAIAYAHGRHIVNKGNRPDYIYRFNTIAERQRFLTQQEQDVDPIDASDPLVRKALRYAAVVGDNWPMAV